MEGKTLFACLLVTFATVFIQGTNGRALLVTTLLEAPFMMIKNDTKLENLDRYEGFIADLLRIMSEETGIEFQVYVVEDGKYGQRDNSGNWNGMIGELDRREMDLAAAPLTRTALREQVVDFTYPFMTAKMTALFHKDIQAESLEDLVNNKDISFGVIENSATEEALLRTQDPLLQQVWSRVNPDTGYLKSSKQGAATARQGNFAFICEEPFGDYLATLPPCDLRTIQNFLITDNARTYNFAAQKRDDLNQNITAINKVIERMSNNNELQNLARGFPFADIWKRVGRGGMVRDREEGIERIREAAVDDDSDGFAFLTEKPFGEYIASRAPCDLRTVEGFYVIQRPRSYALAMPKGHPYLDEINSALLQIQDENGLRNLREKWWHENSECNSSSFPVHSLLLTVSSLVITVNLLSLL